jgi:ADP-heptose:LPS heptosyltransferase
MSFEKIGILRALYLGDMLCAIPAVRAIRHAFPKASISLIGLPWQKDFVERFQHYFDEFVEFPGWPGLPERPVDVEKIPGFLRLMQSHAYDLMVQMQGNGAITNSLCMLFGAEKVSGLRKTGDYCPDEKLFPVSEDSDHEVLRFLKLTRALGISSQGNELEFPFLPGELNGVDDLINKWSLGGKKYICVHPGARDPKRRWPAEYFANIGDRLFEEGYSIVLTGSLAEKEILSAVSRMMKYEPVNAVNESNDFSLGQLAGVIMKSVALCSNDTGVSHIASALGVPSVIIFSRHSDPERWRPLDTRLHTIITPNQSHNNDEVFRALIEVIKRSSQRVQRSQRVLSPRTLG